MLLPALRLSLQPGHEIGQDNGVEREAVALAFLKDIAPVHEEGLQRLVFPPQVFRKTGGSREGPGIVHQSMPSSRITEPSVLSGNSRRSFFGSRKIRSRLRISL